MIKTYRDCEYTFHIPAYLSGTSGGICVGNSLSSKAELGYPLAEIKSEGAYKWYEQETHTNYAFGIVTYRKGSEIYYMLATTNDSENYIDFAKKRLQSAIPKSRLTRTTALSSRVRGSIT